MLPDFNSPATALSSPLGQASAHGPAAPVSRRWTSLYGLVWFGFWMANLVPLQLLLPSSWKRSIRPPRSTTSPSSTVSLG